MRWISILMLTFAGLASWPVVCRGAQQAVVSVSDAPIRERPELDAKVIESLPIGTPIVVSTKNKDGWFKVRAPSGPYGWIAQEHLTLAVYKDQYKHGELGMKVADPHERRQFVREERVFLRVGGMGIPISANDFSQSLGLGPGHLYPAYGISLEAMVAVGDWLRAGLRYMSFSNTTQIQYQAPNLAQNTYEVTQSGAPIMAGVRGLLVGNDDWAIDGAFYAGLSLPNRIKLVTLTQNAPNAFVLESRAPAFLVSFTGRYNFWRWLSVLGELGFYYSAIAKAPPTNAFNGDGIFRNGTGNFSDVVNSQHIGPILMLGLQLAF